MLLANFQTIFQLKSKGKKNLLHKRLLWETNSCLKKLVLRWPSKYLLRLDTRSDYMIIIWLRLSKFHHVDVGRFIREIFCNSSGSKTGKRLCKRCFEISSSTLGIISVQFKRWIQNLLRKLQMLWGRGSLSSPTNAPRRVAQNLLLRGAKISKSWMKLKKCWFRERVNNTEAITNQEVTKMGKDGQDLQRLKMRSSTATKVICHDALSCLLRRAKLLSWWTKLYIISLVRRQIKK